MILPPSILSDQILADSSKKLSELDRAGAVLSSDLFTLERSQPKEIQYEILKEIESDVRNLIICLEDGYDDEHPEKARFLINEVKSVLENARLKQSYRAVAQTVFDIVFSGLSLVERIGSMAHRDAWEYSRSWHEHDYTDVRISAMPFDQPFAKFTVSGSNPDSVQEISVGLRTADSGLYGADVGEFRFFAVPGVRPLTSDPGFNGWVYADGAIYNGRDFPDAYAAFGGVGGKFSVPDVHDFIRLNGLAGRDGNSFSPAMYENSMSPHAHGDIDSAQLKNYGKAAVIGVSVPVCNGAGAPAPGRGLRTGYENRVSAVALSVSIGSVALTSQPTFTDDAGADVESKPAHQEIPLMVYIGKKAK